ncbi:MAG: N-acetyltransferase [Desulfobacteraceae bacterium]|nr:N-acetyltransferase [Desulfobacteraceae bacterium]
MIRKAVIQDIKPIHRLLGYYADQGLLLPRALSELYDHLRDFFVIEDKSQADSIVAVGALGICWEDLAEIRSLAVAEDHQGKSFGSQLVEAGLKEANSLGLKKIFALTYIPGFFSRFGFKEVEKSVLPHKIWADCLKCPKFPDCDEKAVLIEL